MANKKKAKPQPSSLKKPRRQSLSTTASPSKRAEGRKKTFGEPPNKTKTRPNRRGSEGPKPPKGKTSYPKKSGLLGLRRIQGR